jgi:hypothetical protein
MLKSDGHCQRLTPYGSQRIVAAEETSREGKQCLDDALRISAEGRPSPFWASALVCSPAAAVPSHQRSPRVLRTSTAISAVSSPVNSSGTRSAHLKGPVIKDPNQPIGSNVFVWQGGDTHGSTWEGMGFHAGPSVPTAPDTDVLQRIDGAPDVMDVIRDRIKPGTVLVTTDLSASPETRSGSGFTVMDAPTS